MALITCRRIYYPAKENQAMGMVETVSQCESTFSVVVATRNRPRQLTKCLEHLCGQTYPHDKFEVIVVDDGSEPPLDPVCAPFVGRINLRYLRSPGEGVAAARNRGVAVSRARFVAFTDDDVEVGEGWLATLERCLTNDPGSLVGGIVINSLARNIYSTTAQLIVDAVYAHYNRGDQARFFACNNMALARTRFLEVGGFVEPWPLAASEDRVFCRIWRSRGWSMINAPDAVARHAHKLNLFAFAEMYFRYGRGAYLYHHMDHRTTDDDTIVPRLAFYRECWSRAVNGRRPVDAVRIIGLMILWQLANACGYFCEYCGLTSGRV